MRLALAIAALTLVASSAEASEYHLLNDKTKDFAFVDKETVKLNLLGTASLWVLTIFAAPQARPNGTRAEFKLQKFNFLCSQDTVNIGSVTLYDATGSQVDRGMPSGTYDDVIPSSVGASLEGLACQNDMSQIGEQAFRQSPAEMLALVRRAQKGSAAKP